MTLVVQPGALIDCTGREPQSGLEVVVQDDRIRSIGPVGSRTLTEPGGAEIVDAPGGTLIAGLIDLHMHVFQWGQRHDVSGRGVERSDRRS